MRSDVVLLPGLHGSTALFESFIALAPPWANCLPVPLPWEGDQSFGALADRLEPTVRSLESIVLFAESFSGPVAARLAKRLGSKVALLVLCNPLVRAPLPVAPPFSAFLASSIIPEAMVAFAMTGGDRAIAARVRREIRELPKDVLTHRIRVACAARSEDISNRLKAPVLGIVGTKDRLVSPKRIQRILSGVPFARQALLPLPHLAAQVAPVEVWAAITGEFQRAA
jgi:pimeloyl-[acyl-carrier protein] methyl ester esterase